MNASDLVRQWKERAAQKAAERAAQIVPVAVNFAGFPGFAHRLNLMEWAQAGRLPQYLATAMLAAVQGKSTEKRESDLTPEELSAYLRFQCSAFCAMMDGPRFSTQDGRTEDGVERELEDDEMDYAEFILMTPDTVKAAVQWQLDGCPDIPVRTETGETSVVALHSFRDNGEGQSPFESRDGMQTVWWDTRSSPRHL